MSEPVVKALGRIPPPDWHHVEKYPLTATTAPEGPSSMVMGVNWYSAFDNPEQDDSGKWWIGRSGNLGTIRGGHAVALKARNVQDPQPWWAWFNQVSEGICVSEGVARLCGLNNRKRYQPRPLYDECKKRDGIPGEGTFVRTGLEVARDVGLIHAIGRENHWYRTEDIKEGREPDINAGISAFRWARSADDILKTLGYEDKGYVVMLNSWGKDWPHHVHIPIETIERLWHEDGEFGIVTDK